MRLSHWENTVHFFKIWGHSRRWFNLRYSRQKLVFWLRQSWVHHFYQVTQLNQFEAAFVFKEVETDLGDVLVYAITFLFKIF